MSSDPISKIHKKLFQAFNNNFTVLNKLFNFDILTNYYEQCCKIMIWEWDDSTRDYPKQKTSWMGKYVCRYEALLLVS